MNDDEIIYLKKQEFKAEIFKKMLQDKTKILDFIEVIQENIEASKKGFSNDEINSISDTIVTIDLHLKNYSFELNEVIEVIFNYLNYDVKNVLTDELKEILNEVVYYNTLLDKYFTLSSELTFILLHCKNQNNIRENNNND